jgi:hypothetical protein
MVSIAAQPQAHHFFRTALSFQMTVACQAIANNIRQENINAHTYNALVYHDHRCLYVVQ